GKKGEGRKRTSTPERGLCPGQRCVGRMMTCVHIVSEQPFQRTASPLLRTGAAKDVASCLQQVPLLAGRFVGQPPTPSQPGAAARYAPSLLRERSTAALTESTWVARSVLSCLRPQTVYPAVSSCSTSAFHWPSETRRTNRRPAVALAGSIDSSLRPVLSFSRWPPVVSIA